jgi:hypothetical protein
MVETSLFTLDTSHLKNLGQDRAVEFFRRLLWAEASRVGIGRHLIQVPGCINVGDGGIDAYIENADPSSDDVIPRGTSGFQVKSSDLTPSKCTKELHENGNVDAPIKPEVKRLLDKDGNYILVLYADLSVPQKRKRQQAIESELSRLGYKNHVRVYPIDQLIGFAERFINLVTWIKNDLSACLPYWAWSERTDIKRPATFVVDANRNEWINEVRTVLRNPKGVCPVFRIVGLSGIGKTRLVFEALAADDLKNKVAYFPSAAQFRTSTLYTTLQTDQSKFAILVVDECDSQNHDDLVRAFSSKGERLALFTVSYDFARVPPPAQIFNLNPLGFQEIEKLIRSEAKDLPENVVRRLSEFSDGYPRIATLLADSYIKSGGTSDEFIRISDDGLMDRLIGIKELGQDEFKKYKRVLTGVSLFQKIGYEDLLEVEAKWLADFLKVDWTSFGEVVQYERKRGIIQGEYYLSITPFMLRIYLLNDWWEAFGFTKEKFDEFVNSIPEAFRDDLIKRFFDHIPYISTTDRGRKFAKAMLGDVGIYSDGELLRSELGANFFMRLTDADPESALACLQRTIGTWNRDVLLQFTIGRREVVWALERIAIWREFFPDAARLLLALGEAENETWSNNASGVFAELFSPAAGEVSPTEATPEERFVILKEAINANTNERRDLALRACDQALRAGFFSRMVGNEKQGLRKTPVLWRPKTHQELLDSYRRVWKLLSSKIEDLSGEQQKKAINILLQNSRGLGINPHLAGMVISTLNHLIEKGYVEGTQVLTEILNILRYDSKNMPPETTLEWESFRDDLSGADFPSLLRRYVQMDILTDKIDEEGNPVDLAAPQIKKLAELAKNDKTLLIPELAWLVTPKAQNGFQFGYELGAVDEHDSLLPALVEAQRHAGENSSLLFLGGYFRSLLHKDEDIWDQQIEELASDANTAKWIPELTWRSGLTDKAASRVLRLAKTGQVSPNQFRIFEYGSVIRNLSEEVFQAWILFLISTADGNAASISLGLYHFYYVDKETKAQLPKELTFQLLTNHALFKGDQRMPTHTMDEFHWTEIGNAFVQAYPVTAIDLADVILENFGKEGTILGGFHSTAHNILGLIAQKAPKEVWRRIIRYLGPPIDIRAFHIKDWLNGEMSFGTNRTGALSIFPLEEIYEWVDDDVEKRAWYLASFVPKELFRSKDKPCIARELLIRYGHREDVKSNLMANLSSEGWSGPGSTHYQDKKRILLEFKKGETEENVIRWVDEYIASIDREIKRETIREEREGY